MQRHPEVAEVFTLSPARIAKSSSAPVGLAKKKRGAGQGNATRPIRASKQGVIDQLPQRKQDFCGVPSGFRCAIWSPRRLAITCVKSFGIRNLNAIAVSHNVARSLETAFLGAGGRWFESSRPDHFSPVYSGHI